jgi:CDP-glycerol glycerophosphotransferase (TagB/SpsB family)
LTSLPENVRVNWPTDRVSLYDLACIADVGLNAWSSAGKEFALFGIPVVTYAPDLLIYPANINYFAVTPADYFQQVDQALRDGWSIEIARRAFRWCALEYGRAMLDLSDSISFNETRRAPLLERVIRRGLFALDPEYSQFTDCRKRAKNLSQRDTINALITSGKVSVLDLNDGQNISHSTLIEETEALKRAFSRIGSALAKGQINKVESGLVARMANFAKPTALVEQIE